jgi:hypothetical protein
MMGPLCPTHTLVYYIIWQMVMLLPTQNCSGYFLLSPSGIKYCTTDCVPTTHTYQHIAGKNQELSRLEPTTLQKKRTCNIQGVSVNQVNLQQNSVAKFPDWPTHLYLPTITQKIRLHSLVWTYTENGRKQNSQKSIIYEFRINKTKR